MRVRRIATLLLLAAAAAVWTQVILYSHNTLYANGKWIVEKLMLGMPTMGNEMLLLRVPLAGNRLDLGAGYGYEELTLRSVSEPREIRFRYRLEDGAYFALILGKNKDGFRAIRLSRDAVHPSADIDADAKGRFLKIRPIAMGKIGSGWHDVRALISGDELRIEQDGAAILATGSGRPLKGSLGFRGGYKGAYIDDVDVRDASGMRIRDSFANDRNAIPLAALIFTAIALAAAAFFRKSEVKIALFASVLIACGGLYFGFDFYLWSPMDFKALVKSSPADLNFIPGVRFRTMAAIDRFRHRTTGLVYRLAGGEVIDSSTPLERQGYPAEPPWNDPVFCENGKPCRLTSPDKIGEKLGPRRSGERRMLFIGTSQTFGAGAPTVGDSFFALVHGRVSKALPSGSFLTSINMAIAGDIPSHQANLYLKTYFRFRPDLVVVNLGNNGSDDDLRKGMEEILEINRGSGIETVLLLEANHASDPGLSQAHGTTRLLGRAYGVPVLDLHGYLNGPGMAEQGFLWWDYVHMTALGHEQVAQWLAPQLIGYLKKGLRDERRVEP